MTSAGRHLAASANCFSRDIRETFGRSHTLSRLLRDHVTQTWIAGGGGGTILYTGLTEPCCSSQPRMDRSTFITGTSRRRSPRS